MDTFFVETPGEMLGHIEEAFTFLLRKVRGDCEDFIERFFELPCNRENSLMCPPQSRAQLITLATFYLGLCGI